MFWYTASAVPEYQAFSDTRCDAGRMSKLVALAPEEVPTALEMADQAVRLVLRGDADPADAGIDRVREGEVDDAPAAAEHHGRLGATVGQLMESAATSSRQDIGERVACEAGSDPALFRH